MYKFNCLWINLTARCCRSVVLRLSHLAADKRFIIIVSYDARGDFTLPTLLLPHSFEPHFIFVCEATYELDYSIRTFTRIDLIACSPDADSARVLLEAGVVVIEAAVADVASENGCLA